jgi:hypothetical protein
MEFSAHFASSSPVVARRDGWSSAHILLRDQR